MITTRNRWEGECSLHRVRVESGLLGLGLCFLTAQAIAVFFAFGFAGKSRQCRHARGAARTAEIVERLLRQKAELLGSAIRQPHFQEKTRAQSSKSASNAQAQEGRI